MPDYSKGKIYKIWSPSTGLMYIGSTTQSLSKRMGQHRGRKDTNSRQVMACKDVRIDLIENVSCCNKEQLRKIEAKYILENDCVNKHLEGITTEQFCEINNVQPLVPREYVRDTEEKVRQYEYGKMWRDQNREHYIKRRLKYRENNREEILRKKREYHQKNYRELYAKRREYFLEYNKQRVKCECGCEISRGKLRMHQKTPKHKYLIEQKQKETPTNTGKSNLQKKIAKRAEGKARASMENYERSVDELLKTMEKFRESVENYCK